MFRWSIGDKYINIYPDRPGQSYVLNRKESCRFRIEMVGPMVVFSVQRFINGAWQNVFEPCRQFTQQQIF
jgi:hypothetical protein